MKSFLLNFDKLSRSTRINPSGIWLSYFSMEPRRPIHKLYIQESTASTVDKMCKETLVDVSTLQIAPNTWVDRATRSLTVLNNLACIKCSYALSFKEITSNFNLKTYLCHHSNKDRTRLDMIQSKIWPETKLISMIPISNIQDILSRFPEN